MSRCAWLREESSGDTAIPKTDKKKAEKEKTMKNDSYEYSGLSLKVFFALVISLSLAAEVVYCLGGPGWSVLVLM